jgi:glycosyltransferase involved in cell wall biosynthesis
MGLTDNTFSASFDAVVMLTVSDWHTEPRSNRYHYATRFARNYPVIFVQADRIFNGYVIEPSGYPRIEILHVPQKSGEAQTSAIVEALSELRILRPLLWIYSANYVHATENIFAALRIFHATEDYFSKELSYQLAPGYFDRLRLLFSHLDLLVAVSEGVRDSYINSGGFRGNTLLLENGCDYAFFRKAIDETPHIPSPVRPVAFYQGGINSRLDYDLMIELAHTKSDWDFLLCGNWDDTNENSLKLFNLPNVTYLGVLSPEKIAHESACATVGLIPFVQTPFIQKKSLPLKAFEYVACGLPVVSVPIDALIKIPEVFLFASNAADFGVQMEQARLTRYDPQALALRLDIAAQQDYDKRFDILTDTLASMLKVSESHNQKLNVLFLYSANSTYTATVQEYISSFAKFSSHNFVFADAVNGVSCHFNMAQFDAVFVHYSVRLTLDSYISPAVVNALKNSSVYKLLFIQDEYENTERARQWMDEIGFHAVFSCIPLGQIPQVYPPNRFPSTEFVSILTGYVPQSLEQRRWGLPLSKRPIVLGYRGRRLPFRFGRLGQEKYQIGLQMRAFCEQQGIVCDIEWDENKRIYGDKWYEFIGSCRAMLGSESGSNVFDFDGSLQSTTEEAIQNNPDMTFDEFHAIFLRELDGQIRMNQVSPRIFEAVAIGTPLVLFEGEYSNVVFPGKHYIELKKDFSNVQEVLEQLEDFESLQAMADRAWRDVIGSGNYSFLKFVTNIDQFLYKRVAKVKPWIPLLGVIGQIRGDVNEGGLESSNMYIPRGAAVNWPLPYSCFTETPPTSFATPVRLVVNDPSIFLNSNPYLNFDRAQFVILARRAVVRILNYLPLNLRSPIKKLLLKIARTMGLLSLP